MPSPEEQAYSAVERAYGQGDFARALELARALQPQLQPNRPDLLDQRLQLLLGHIHLYGLAQPREAEAAYQAVLESCEEANYRQLAEQSLNLCAQPAAESTAAPSVLPATPWLQQLEDPQQALAQIQEAWTTVVPSVAPDPVPQAAATQAARPWTAAGLADLEATKAEPSIAEAHAPIPDEQPARIEQSDESQVLVASAPSPQPEALDQPGLESEQQTIEPPTFGSPALSERTGAELTDEERIELERGLLLVKLSSRARPEDASAPIAGGENTSRQQQEPSEAGSSWQRFKNRWLRLSRPQPNDGGGSGR
jgi:hypothetical protein